MNEQLLKNNYLYIPQFICPDRALELSKNFIEDSKKEEFPGDGQAWNSRTCYNYTPALELLCEKTEHVSEIVGVPVLPTYTYGRVYHNKSILEKHTDRPACEISATVNLDGDSPWPIWIETPTGNNVCLTLNPGDAMIYLGCIAPHWRDEYYGEWYSQFFLHYVRSCGPCAPCYFDKYKPNEFEKDEMIEILSAESQGKIVIENNHNDKCSILSDSDLESMEIAKEDFAIYKQTQKGEFESMNNESLESTESKIEEIIKSLALKKQNLNKNEESPFVRVNEFKKEERTSTKSGKVEYKSLLQNIKDQSSTEESFSNKNNNYSIKSRNLSDFILEFEDIIPQELCDDIISEYAKTDYWSSALTGGGHDPNARRCDVISISQQEIININKEHRLNMDGALYNCVSTALSEYESKFPEMDLEIQEDTGYELLRYKTGDFYVQHSDHFKQSPRTLSCTLSLNEDFEGGEFAFFNRELKYKLKKGSILMFPSNFMYPHEVMPVTSGTRYSIITWLI